jgi:hypothetical protein
MQREQIAPQISTGLGKTRDSVKKFYSPGANKTSWRQIFFFSMLRLTVGKTHRPPRTRRFNHQSALTP